MLLVIRNILFLFTITLIFSCKKTYKQANPAFFVTCNDASTITGTGQGYASDNITDLWFYSNGLFRGAYPVGSKMPVMIENNKSVFEVYAGIKNNGISSTRISWLFYEPIKIDTLVEPGQSITRNFAFKYRSSVKFPWVENFETQGFSMIKSGISDTTFKIHTNDAHVFDGTKSIELGLSGSGLFAQIETVNTYTLPLNSGNVYLELDYKANCEFNIGTSTNGIFYPAVTVTAKDNWHKIYVQLSESITIDKSTDQKKVIIQIKRDTNISEQKVYLDNFKLVYI